MPLLAPVLGIDAEHGYQPVAAEGRKLYELISAGGAGLSLACLGTARLVIAEDVHWFDPSSLEVLGAYSATRPMAAYWSSSPDAR